MRINDNCICKTVLVYSGNKLFFSWLCFDTPLQKSPYLAYSVRNNVFFTALFCFALTKWEILICIISKIMLLVFQTVNFQATTFEKYLTFLHITFLYINFISLGFCFCSLSLAILLMSFMFYSSDSRSNPT